MSFATYGDLASTFQTRHLNARMKQDLSRLGMELATGRKSDVTSATSGDYGPIAGIEHSLKLLTAHKQATNEAATLTATAQLVLGNIQEQTQDVSSGLIGAISSHNTTLIGVTAVDAREKFASIISSLNTNVGGRSLFAGAATDGQALADTDTIISALLSAASGQTTASGVAMQIDAWFDDVGGGFETTGYIGADADMGPIQLGNGETVSLSTKADSTEIRDLLSALAKSVVISEGVLSGDATAQRELSALASSELLGAIDGLTMTRARVGAVEARIENATVQNAAERAALELARNELTAVDPYETATALEALYGQMESLYTVTARLSKLSFTDYMR